MRRLFIVALAVLVSSAAFAQTDTVEKRTILKPGNLPRSGDHFLLQLGYTTWMNKPDSISTGGLPRTFNAYFMLDFPFKTNPHWSVAIGAGIATDNMYFEKTAVEIAGRTTNLVFRNQADTNHFKKYKLQTTYAEAPVELRFRTNPDDDRRSVKFAVGAKVGTMLSAHTKGTTLQDKGGNTINDYKTKDFNKRYFNTTRLSATARAGFGHFTLFGAYQLTPLFKEGLAPAIRPLTVGLTLSGL
jgi:hypothetical protein